MSTGRMTFIGQAGAGSSCFSLISFEGRVKGAPGVARFWGKGHVPVAEFLYDKDGKLVGSDQVLATGPDDIPWELQCCGRALRERSLVDASATRGRLQTADGRTG